MAFEFSMAWERLQKKLSLFTTLPVQKGGNRSGVLNPHWKFPFEAQCTFERKSSAGKNLLPLLEILLRALIFQRGRQYA